MTTPMIRCLRTRFPDAQIDMVVRRDFLDLIAYSPYLNHKITLDRHEGVTALWSLRKTINEEAYDLIYDAHRSLRTRILMPFLKARYKAYFQKHYLRRNLSLFFKLPLIKGTPRFLERFIHPLIPFGVKYDGKGPEIVLGKNAIGTAIEKVPLLPKNNQLRIGLIPSAQWSGKRWPLDNFRILIEEIIRKTNHLLVIFGGKEDTFCQELIQNLPTNRITNTQGLLSIAEAASFLRECDFVIANDTGLMHVADALNIPSVLFLGPTSGDLGCLPFHPDSQILEHKLWCRPCSKNGEAPCIRGKRVCLTRTTPLQAFEATLQLIRRKHVLSTS